MRTRVRGLPFEQASDAPDWEALRDRTEDEELARELGLEAGHPFGRRRSKR